MMTEELKINKKVIENSQDDYDAIREAIKKLSSASENDFESMKKEKWFQRVFDMVTFSKKNEKRLAQQIETVSQAQQILMELLLRLSEQDKNISQIVVDSLEDIKKIQEQNSFLLSTIMKLEKLSLGIRDSLDIRKLTENEKCVLCTSLYKICEVISESSDDQQQYATTTLNYLGISSQMNNMELALEQMNTSSKKAILKCCMEYIFLKDCSWNSFEQYADFIDEFDFGNKTIRELKEQISNYYKLCGKEGLLNKYQDIEEENISDTFVSSFEEDVKEETEEEVPLTEETIHSILQIRKGEVKVFRNTELHIHAYINCEGTLKFENCRIYYNEVECADEITLSEGASLTVRNSVIICKGLDKNKFITGKGCNCFQFENVIFVDCAYFVEASDVSTFDMENCRLENCYDEFVDIRLKEEGICTISRNIIHDGELRNFYKTKSSSATLFSLSNYYGKISAVFEDNYIYENKEHFIWEKDNEFSEITYVSGNQFEVRRCTFNGISANDRKGVCAKKVIECKFEDCNGVIRMHGEAPCVDNCTFVHCTNIVETDDDAHISNCQFIACYGKLIFPKGYNGGVTIEFCEFVNTVNKLKYSSTWNPESCIVFRRDKESRTKVNYLRKCIFDGVNLGDTFLISANGFEKPYGTVTYIEDCDFRNCKTERSSGQIIKEFLQYDKLFKKNVDYHANEVRNCRGLDKINKEKSEVRNIIEKTVSTEGNPIGTAMVTLSSDQLAALERWCSKKK